MSWPALLNRDGHLTPELTVTIVEQVAAALDAAHEQGLVHRDVKPSNLLITADEFVYLIDFGIARGEAAPKLTYTGSILGTWGYMAPERFTDGTNDACVDIYALACVLYECLTGQLPFPGETLEQQFTGHTTQDPPRPTDVKPELPAGFRRGDRPGFGQESRPALPHRPGTGRRGSPGARRRIRPRPVRHRPHPERRHRTAGGPAAARRDTRQQRHRRAASPIGDGHTTALTGRAGMAPAQPLATRRCGRCLGHRCRRGRRDRGKPDGPDPLAGRGTVRAAPAGTGRVAVHRAQRPHPGRGRPRWRRLRRRLLQQPVAQLASGSFAETELPFSGLHRPQSLAVDTTGTVYVSDLRGEVLTLPIGPDFGCSMRAKTLREPHTLPAVMLSSQTRFALRRVPLAVWFSVLLLIAALAMPIKQRCGTPSRSCASTLDANGNLHYYYEVEPLGVFLLEMITGTNIRWYYTSGEEIS
ncbi:hypothetical protein BST40_09970 [Mycobacterium persicum]|nr:serine/threonine-protein kinase [Mycobacterium persicum]ORB51940.1 hypothetical protein BST40_09970 [Mycobacterium persicum]